MLLYLLRHGTAEPTQAVKDDADRKLVAEGKAQCELVAQVLGAMGVQPDLWLTSPLRRARQTVGLVRDRLESVAPLEVAEWLRPDAIPAEAIDAIRRLSSTCVIAAGHEPLLGRMAAGLIGGGHADLKIRKGGIVEIDLSEGEAKLLGLLRPGHFKRLVRRT